MLKTTAFVIILLTATSASHADQGTCDRLSKQAENEQIHFSPVEGYKVVGEGRLYFHSAPDAKCRTKDVFVVPKDRLVGYSEYKGWYSVMYVNPKTGEDFEGWVDSRRLESTGTMGPKS